MVNGSFYRICKFVFLVLMLGLLSFQTASAQSFPSRPITLIVPYPAGGAVDIQARSLAQTASRTLGQPITVMNRVGASGAIGAQSIRTAAPDGYTLMMFGGNLFGLPNMQEVSYDPLKDFTYVIRLVEVGFGITVAPNAPWKTVPDLLSHARANSGKVTVGSLGPGGTAHVAVMELAEAAGVKLNYIPYKGASDAHLAVLGGHIDFAADTAYAPLVNAGTLRLLAIMNESRNAKYSSTPTLKDLGYDIAASSTIGIVGPRGIEAGVVKVIQDAFHKALVEPEFKQLIDRQDMSITYLDSAGYTEFAARQTSQLARAFRKLGLQRN